MIDPEEQPKVRLKGIVRDYSTDDYIYNAQNELSAIIHRLPIDSTKIIYRQDYSYDQSGRLKSELYTNGPAATQNYSKRVDSEYNTDGQLVREVYFTGDSQPEQYQIDSIFYDAQKRIAKRKLVGRFDSQSSTLEYVYTAQNNIESVYNTLIAYPNRGITSFRSKTNYTYDGLINPFYGLAGVSISEYHTPNNKTKEVTYVTYQMSGDLETLFKLVVPSYEYNYSYEYKDGLPVSSSRGNSITKYVYETR